MSGPVDAGYDGAPGFSVIGLGQCSLDILGRVTRYPGVDAKVDLTETLIQGGGPVATALVTLARLGEKTAFVGRVGDDDFGRRIRRGLQDEKVDCGYLRIDPGASSQFSFIAVEEQHGYRNIFCHRGSAAPLGADEIRDDLVQGSRVLHLDGGHPGAALKAAGLARSAGGATVLDGGSWRPEIAEILPLIDHLVVSERFVRALYPDCSHENGVERLMAHGAVAATVTLGAGGSWTLKRGGGCVYQPAFPVPAVDTTGCGDVFHGAYIFGLLRHWPIEKNLRFAAACAAIKATALGGRSGIPDRTRVESFLADQADP